MRELIAKQTKAKIDITTDAEAFLVNSSFPQFDAQSSILVAAEDDDEINRYANICPKSVLFRKVNFAMSYNG